MTNSTFSPLVTALAACVIAITAWPSVSRADITYTVDSTLDQFDDDINDGICHTSANTCTLRAAVMQANQNGTNTVINIPAGTYLMTENSQPGVRLTLATPAGGNPKISLVGSDADATIIDGNFGNVLVIRNGRAARVAGVTIRGGNSGNPGGGVRNEGTLTMDRCVIRENRTNFVGGGGISNAGSAVISDTIIELNSGSLEIPGCGISNEGNLTLIRSTVRNNCTQTNPNVAIVNYNGTLKIVESTLSDNLGNDGGAILNSSILTIINSTLSGNSANRSGGAIHNNGSGLVNIYNSSIIGNEADHDQDLNGTGGGLFNAAGSSIAIRNTLLAGNFRSGNPVFDDCKGSLAVYGRNLKTNDQSASNCSVTGPGSMQLVNSLSLIGTLADNGGPTLTHALLSGSNAIDFGDPVGGCVNDSLITLATDQRGFQRVAGVRCDVGAYEFGAINDFIFRSGFESTPPP